MSDIERAFVRLRRIVLNEVTRLRRIPEALLLVAAALVVVGVIRATASGADWAGILRSQAVNLVSAAVLAGFAYLLFVLRFRRGQLRTYLERQRARTPTISHRDPELSALANTIVNELLNARPPHAALIIGPADAGQAQLLAEVAELLTPTRVPVSVTLPSAYGDVSLPALVRDRFIDELVGSSGDAQSGRRLYASLVRRGRIVALVRGLDRVGQGEPLGTRRAAIARLLEASLTDGIPFVAWVHQDLAPSISEVAAFRTRPLPRSELVAYMLRQLRERKLPGPDTVEATLTRAFDEGESTRDPVLLSLVADLVVRRVRAGERADEVVTALFSDTCAFRRHLEWMSEWALDCRLEDLEETATPASLALAAIGRESHYRQEAELRSDDAAGALDADDRRRFAAGIALLSHRRVLDVSHADGGTVVRFSHPAWLAFAGALGLRLDPFYWRDLLRPDTSSATLDALAAALLIFGPEKLQERSYVRVLRDVGLREGVEISLEMALAVITALQSNAEPLELGRAEMDALERSWSTADDVVKTRFISDVSLKPNPNLIEFLWSRVVPPQFDVNSFRVRRAICSRLGSLGSATWQHVGEDWRKLVDAAHTGDLSSWTRRSEHWSNYGYAVASLGWTLPSVARIVEKEDEDDIFELLADLRSVVQRRSIELGPDERPREIGLEISLAEGFKVAAVDVSARRQSCDDRWCAATASFLESSTSWISKQALLQALGLVLVQRGRDQLERVAGRWESAGNEHAFVRETAALVRRTLTEAKGPETLTARDIWLEDVEALDDGGVNLSAEAHRLLGLSTLLINLAEWPFTAWIRDEEGATELSVERRERAFTGVELPRCFSRAGHASTMFDKACDCPFKFCGPAVKERVLGEARRFSRSFLQRARATAGAPRLSGSVGRNGFAGKAFGVVWRELDEELAKKEPHLGPR